jgi:dolichol-phosphate mannosyltransferase
MTMEQSPENVLISTPQAPLEIPAVPADGPGGSLPAPKLSLVIPTYNESRNITDIVLAVSAVLERSIPGRYELIVVDDDSPDGTWKIAQGLIARHPFLRVVRRPRERGLATAVVRGWQAARGDILGVIDADLQHPPETLTELVAAIEQGADLAVASRNVPGGGISHWSVARRLISRGAQLLGLVIVPEVVSRVSDPMSGFFMVKRSAISQRVLNPAGYKILVEVLARGDIDRISEIAYVFQERKKGGSQANGRIFIQYVIHLIRLRMSSMQRRRT